MNFLFYALHFFILAFVPVCVFRLSSYPPYPPLSTLVIQEVQANCVRKKESVPQV